MNIQLYKSLSGFYWELRTDSKYYNSGFASYKVYAYIQAIYVYLRYRVHRYIAIQTKKLHKRYRYALNTKESLF
jgi:hypothetical protein